MPNINDSKCVLVTGATSGIGRALALSIAALPSHPQVIGTGRRQERLDELAKRGLETYKLDVDTDRETLKKAAEDIIKNYPDLDTVILNAGIQHEFNLAEPESINLDNFVSELNVNYTSVVTMIKYLLPHLLRLGRPAFVVTITSGLSVTPGAWVPNYSATKAAVHNFTLSLRATLETSNVQVMEISPPLVESELHDAYGTTEKFSQVWMPLDVFTKTAMDGLRQGDHYITAGQSEVVYKRFEEGKEEFVRKSFQAIKSSTYLK